MLHEERHRCGTREPHHALHITDARFVSNTARNNGGNIYFFNNSSVCNHINIINSSIIRGQAAGHGGGQAAGHGGGQAAGHGGGQAAGHGGGQAAGHGGGARCLLR